MKVRQMLVEDIELVLEIETQMWGSEAATIEQITQRLQTFPMGSIVAEDEFGRLVGYAALQLVNHISNKSWAEQTDNGCILKTHKANGQLAYGVSMSGIKHGVGKAIIAYSYDTFVRSGLCNLICLGSRLPGFEQWHNNTQRNIKSYVSEKVGGFSRDPELRLYEKNGFLFLWEIEGYFPDRKSLDYGALIIRK